MTKSIVGAMVCILALIELASMGAAGADDSDAAFDVAAAANGGEVESITGTYGPGHTGRNLIEGRQDAKWSTEAGATFPFDIVISFYRHEPVRVAAVRIALPADGAAAPKAVEIWVSMTSPADGFTKVAAATLDAAPAVQAIQMSPVQARYVRVRITESTDPYKLAIDQLQIIEAFDPGYTSLRSRHPEIAQWKDSPQFAAQRGIDWLQMATIDWQNKNQCFGCHVQAQTLMGLSIARRNDYVVSGQFLQDEVAFIRTNQTNDGTEDVSRASSPVTATQFAGMSLAYFDQATGGADDGNLRKAAERLLGVLAPDGELAIDANEAPIMTGSFMPTTNAAIIFSEAYAQSGDARFKAAADSAMAWIASHEPKTTQDEIFKILALSKLGDATQAALIPPLVDILTQQQDPKGGWRETSQMAGPNAFATGQVLYALKQTGMSVAAPVFVGGVKYLLETQLPSGAWPSQNSQSGRPSEFAPTMWAVIGLAGTVTAAPDEHDLKQTIDLTGKLVLHINFDFDKATLRPDALPLIDQVAGLMKDTPSLRVEIDGHTDAIGTVQHNQVLSERRAQAVIHALEARGIAAGRLSGAGFGSSKPIADNATDAGRFQNRRVEVVRK